MKCNNSQFNISNNRNKEKRPTPSAAIPTLNDTSSKGPIYLMNLKRTEEYDSNTVYFSDSKKIYLCKGCYYANSDDIRMLVVNSSGIEKTFNLTKLAKSQEQRLIIANINWDTYPTHTSYTSYKPECLDNEGGKYSDLINFIIKIYTYATPSEDNIFDILLNQIYSKFCLIEKLLHSPANTPIGWDHEFEGYTNQEGFTYEDIVESQIFCQLRSIKNKIRFYEKEIHYQKDEATPKKYKSFTQTEVYQKIKLFNEEYAKIKDSPISGYSKELLDDIEKIIDSFAPTIDVSQSFLDDLDSHSMLSPMEQSACSTVSLRSLSQLNSSTRRNITPSSSLLRNFGFQSGTSYSSSSSSCPDLQYEGHQPGGTQ